MPLIELTEICLKYGNHTALRDINLKIEKNQIITLVGPNGGGKTSLAKIILGLIAQNSGKLQKKDGIQMSYMPQKIVVNQELPLSARNFLNLTIGKNNKKSDSEISALAFRLGLTEIMDRQFNDLSGGEQQKLSFLRAISKNYDLLVLDEPTQFMDLLAIDEFYLIIEEIRKKTGCAILLISHDLHLVMQKTDLVYCINRHICCQGHSQQIEKNPEFLKIFGDNFSRNSSNKNLIDGSKISHLGVYQHHHDHLHK